MTIRNHDNSEFLGIPNHDNSEFLGIPNHDNSESREILNHGKLPNHNRHRKLSSQGLLEA